VKQAFERLTESLKGMLAEFQIPAIAISPIVEIFPYAEELDKELSRRPLEEADVVDEETGVVFSAPGSDIEDEED